MQSIGGVTHTPRGKVQETVALTAPAAVADAEARAPADAVSVNPVPPADRRPVGASLGVAASIVGGSLGQGLATAPLLTETGKTVPAGVAAQAAGLAPGLATHRDRLLSSPAFAALDEGVQSLALKCLAYIDRAESQEVRDATRAVLAERGLQTEGDGRLHVTGLASLGGFARISRAEQAKLLLSTCGGGTPHVLLTLLTEKKLAAMPVDAQAATLQQLARDLPLASRLEEPPRISIEGKPIYDYGERDAGHAYGVTVGEKLIPVVIPSQEPPAQGVRYPSLMQVVRALRALPDELREGVEAVTVYPVRKPSKAGLDGGALADSGAGGVPGLIRFFASADWDQGVVDGTMVHEAGHIRTNAAWGREGRSFRDETATPAWAAWRQAMEADGISASGYARVSPTEDFSETLRATFLFRGTPLEGDLRALMPHRAALLDAVVPSWAPQGR